MRGRTYEHIPLGVIRIDDNRVITYANKAMRELTGTDELVGMDIMSFVSDEKGRATLEEELRKRFGDLQGSQYDIEMLHPLNGRRIPVTIFAAPEFNDEGNLVGSVGFVRDRRLDVANQALHNAIQQEATETGLLTCLSSVLSELISYDFFRVTMVSQDRRHLMVLREVPENLNNEMRALWWPIPRFWLEYMKRVDIHSLDMVEWFKDPEAQKLAAEDLDVQKWLNRGIKHTLVHPILQEGQVVAFVALETKNNQAYGQSEIQILKQ